MKANDKILVPRLAPISRDIKLLMCSDARWSSENSAFVGKEKLTDGQACR